MTVASLMVPKIHDTGIQSWLTEMMIYVFGRAVIIEQVSEFTCQIKNTPRIPGPSPFINLKREKARKQLKKYKKSNCRWYKYIV